MKHKLLIVDDEKNVRVFLSELFRTDRFEVETAANGAEAVDAARNFQPDVIILDLKLPDANGADLIIPLKKLSEGVEIIIITALGTIDNAVSTIKSGAYDFITKPFDVDSITIAVDRCLDFREVNRENMILKRMQQECNYFQEFIGESPEIKIIKGRIFKLADTDVPVLITGETGTGKNILAHQIHHTLNASTAPLVYVNCATLSETLFESELFGHEKGAFTGAVESKSGRVEDADGGTLILDEISEIPINIQAKLLSFLQDKSFYRVGGRHQKSVHVRIIALTNRKLEEEIEKGTFRKDLFYRLNVIKFDIPPLRERAVDIPLLASHFMKMFNARYGERSAWLNKEQMLQLQRCSWPGNTRELKNILEQAYIYSENGEMKLENIDEGSSDKINCSGDLKFQMDAYEKKLILQALSENGGNRASTAEALGISIRTLHYRLNYYDIQD